MLVVVIRLNNEFIQNVILKRIEIRKELISLYNDRAVYKEDLETAKKDLERDFKEIEFRNRIISKLKSCGLLYELIE